MKHSAKNLKNALHEQAKVKSRNAEKWDFLDDFQPLCNSWNIECQRILSFVFKVFLIFWPDKAFLINSFQVLEGERESCFRKRSKNQYSINGWWSVLVSFTILARDQPSWAPIDSTKIQLRLEVIQNTQLPQLVFFFFLCQTVMRNWEFPKGDLISRRVESKKSLWLLYMRPLSQCMQMLQGLNGTCCQLLQQLWMTLRRPHFLGLF